VDDNDIPTECFYEKDKLKDNTKTFKDECNTYPSSASKFGISVLFLVVLVISIL
jgi:hypothetical protein